MAAAPAATAQKHAVPGAAPAMGSASHGYPASAGLLNGRAAARNLADAVHFLCSLHGRYPGLIDHAAARTIDQPLRGWFLTNQAGFAAERAYLAQLIVAAGPIPSTPGGARSEAASAALRQALDTLGRSERSGCALGAAAAMIEDWGCVRRILDRAAERLGLETPPLRLVPLRSDQSPMHGAAGSPALQRAFAFGAEQMLLQHARLWDLLEARAAARG